MKLSNSIFALFVISCCWVHQGQAQIEFGAKVGLSSYDLAREGIVISKGNTTFEQRIVDADYGHHIGIYTRLTLLGVFVEPALLFNSNNVTYQLSTYDENGVFNTIRNEKYNHLDLPIMAGFKVGFMRFQGGIVGHLLINKISDAVDIKGYEQRFQNATYGWQAGTGIDFWRLRLDLNYEGSVARFGDYVTIGGQEVALAKSPSRFIFSLGFKF